jgi:hypothetical protein
MFIASVFRPETSRRATIPVRDLIPRAWRRARKRCHPRCAWRLHRVSTGCRIRNGSARLRRRSLPLRRYDPSGGPGRELAGRGRLSASATRPYNNKRQQCRSLDWRHFFHGCAPCYSIFDKHTDVSEVSKEQMVCVDRCPSRHMKSSAQCAEVDQSRILAATSPLLRGAQRRSASSSAWKLCDVSALGSVGWCAHDRNEAGASEGPR